MTLTVSTLLVACVSTPGHESEVVAIDEDGDDRIDVWRTIGPDTISIVRAPAPGSDPSHTLLLAIDAIPYDTFAELQREGHFRAFFPASRLVAPFPSLTNVGFTAILQTAKPLGYEDFYFDPEAGDFGGGAWERLTGEYKRIAPFHGAFDWEEPRLWGAFVYFFPDRIRLAELLRIEEIMMEAVRRHDEPGDVGDRELVLYMGSTDAVGHVRGRQALRKHLLDVERVLERFLAAGGGAWRVILFSDHAMSTEPSRRFDLEAALERAGYRLGDAIEAPSDVVAPEYGLVGSVQIYTAPGEEEGVARAVVAQEGADFAVWRAEDRIAPAEMTDANGGAGTGVRIGAVDAVGSADPLDRPADEYPHLRERVRRALANHTQNPASVLVSLEDGWHYGSALFDRLVGIVGTHGSARASSSVGFLASNVESTPAWVDADEAHRYLGLRGLTTTAIESGESP